MKQYLKDLLEKIWADLKQAWKSWTIWANVVALPGLAVVWPQVMDALPQLQALLPENKVAQFVAVASVVNIILRFKTSAALADK